jgi:MYXO-CTERM domain-containing protein
MMTAMTRALGLALVLAGCSASPPPGSVREAIIGGTTDEHDTSVLLVVAQEPGSMIAHLCTGEVISPHVILTAAHCVDPATVGATAKFLVFVGTTLTASSPPADFLGVQETHFDAAFNPDPAVFQTQGHDIGVVILRGPTSLAPLRYNHAPLAPAMQGQPARLVGFGVTSASDTSASTAGTRREAPSKLAKLTSNLLTFADGTHDICEGDSGGPAFMSVAGAQTIVGVTAFGPATCDVNAGGVDTRIDIYASSYLDGFVQQFDPPAKSGAALGASCAGDLECASELCGQIGGTSFCATACDPTSATPECPAGMVCAAIDEGTYCAPSTLASAATARGCAVAPHAPADAGAAWLIALALVALARRRARG